jgi:hypothetical protein
MSPKVVFNGKEYDSPEAMPADVREKFEAAISANPGLRDTSSSIPTLRPSDAGPVAPPAVDADGGRRFKLVRVLLWVVVAAAVLIWLLSRR